MDACKAARPFEACMWRLLLRLVLKAGTMGRRDAKIRIKGGKCRPVGFWQNWVKDKVQQGLNKYRSMPAAIGYALGVDVKSSMFRKWGLVGVMADLPLSINLQPCAAAILAHWPAGSGVQKLSDGRVLKTLFDYAKFLMDEEAESHWSSLWPFFLYVKTVRGFECAVSILNLDVDSIQGNWVCGRTGSTEGLSNSPIDSQCKLIVRAVSCFTPTDVAAAGPEHDRLQLLLKRGTEHLNTRGMELTPVDLLRKAGWAPADAQAFASQAGKCGECIVPYQS